VGALKVGRRPESLTQRRETAMESERTGAGEGRSVCQTRQDSLCGLTGQDEMTMGDKRQAVRGRTGPGSRARRG
jgi:hypothetical protein